LILMICPDQEKTSACGKTGTTTWRKVFAGVVIFKLMDVIFSLQIRHPMQSRAAVIFYCAC
jgi:hypothetical protein